MRSIFTLLFCFFILAVGAQTMQKDSLIIVGKNPEKGFKHDYLLFIPKGTPLNKEIVLLVEPNNTGKLSDDMAVHQKHAIELASVSSVGNNISTELKIPLLVPVFPRPEKDSLMYTHALDRDVMVEGKPEFKRLDLQLLEMISDAKNVLTTMNIRTDSKFFMSGFSASGTFINRFSFIHPDKIKALAIGGFNGELMLPYNEINAIKLDYPIGTNDFSKLFGSNFNMTAYKQIPQYIYLGKLDDNDAVQYDDAYNETERKIINENIGDKVQERYIKCQQIYSKENINASFKTIENVGHWTTAEMNLAVVKFFLTEMKKQ